MFDMGEILPLLDARHQGAIRDGTVRPQKSWTRQYKFAFTHEVAWNILK